MPFTASHQVVTTDIVLNTGTVATMTGTVTAGDGTTLLRDVYVRTRVHGRQRERAGHVYRRTGAVPVPRGGAWHRRHPPDGAQPEDLRHDGSGDGDGDHARRDRRRGRDGAAGVDPPGDRDDRAGDTGAERDRVRLGYERCDDVRRSNRQRHVPVLRAEGRHVSPHGGRLRRRHE
ncbi:MAG: hypothetical protein QM736_02950 [Vicinamibacterales bacterium]